MLLSRYQKIQSRFSEQRVLVIGDLMLDTYLWGDAERISPEAPVPVIRVRDVNHNPGGAANVALNVSTLSAQASVLGIVGDDAEGKKLTALLKESGIDTTGIIFVPDRPTTVKTRIIAHNQQVVRTDREARSVINHEIRKSINNRLDQILPNVQGLIIEDYDKGLLSPETIKLILKRAAERNLPIYVDPKKKNFLQYSGVRLLKPNAQELAQAAGIGSQSDSFTKDCQNLRRQQKIEILLITQGERGLSLFTREGEQTIPTKARRVHDVSGAGDTVISTFTLSDLVGATPKEAATLANYAAGRVCEEVGVVPITLAMLGEIVAHHNNV
jgi:rfaE bifunctional protein kinase chain/domain